MGIRIHKFLGYGLNDVRTGEDHKVVDPRINPDSPFFNYELPSLSSYKDWLEENSDPEERSNLDSWYLNDPSAGGPRRRTNLDSCFAWSPEFGIPSVLAIQPVSAPDWSRQDDAIDYAEEIYVMKTENLEPRVHALPHGIHPYSASYIDSRTGEKLNNRVMWWVRAVSDGTRYDGELDSLAADCGFKNHQEAEKYIAPFVPTEIRNLARFANLFTKEDGWLDLRPLLYVYWS